MRTIQRQVRGTDGRKTGPRTTAFPTWLSFEEEMEYIWRNARDFNEDGSEIFNYAGILEVGLITTWECATVWSNKLRITSKNALPKPKESCPTVYKKALMAALLVSG